MDQSEDISSPGGGRVCILVLGDIGHSPRMQYHALSCAAHNYDVDLVGYGGSRPHEKVLSNARINLHLMDDVPQFGNYVPRLLKYGVKVLWQVIVLFKVLLLLPKPSHILVQNPPSIPTLAIAWMYSLIRNCVFVIDWHNYGFTILSLTLGESHLLVKLCRWFEGYFGSKADYHLCVTNALKEDLNTRFHISDAIVLYDRPPSIFRMISLDEKHALLMKLKKEYEAFGVSNGNVGETNETAFTFVRDLQVISKQERPALLISSTSWTEDEDFNILFDALIQYDIIASDPDNKLPNMICVITGKGPLKAHFQEMISEKNFTYVKIVLPWLTAEDYPKILASADIGVSLHKSSSNLDLPMKIVDMFGCCLPVCALDYPCITELVQHEKNGLLFQTSHELSDQLKFLFRGFPTDSSLIGSFRKELKSSFNALRWDQCWDENALEIFQE